MFERFTDRARKAMALANQEAMRLRHEYIGTEHVLLGLVKEGSGVAAVALKALGADLRRVRIEVEKLLVPGREEVHPARLPYTPRMKRILEDALPAARALGGKYVGTEHLLLGLAHDTEGVAGQVLVNLGVTYERALESIRELLKSPEEAAKLVSAADDVPEHLRDHPLVQEYVALLHAWRDLKDEYLVRSDYERAAAVRDRHSALRGELLALLARLHEDPQFGRTPPYEPRP